MQINWNKNFKNNFNLFWVEFIELLNSRLVEYLSSIRIAIFVRYDLQLFTNYTPSKTQSYAHLRPAARHNFFFFF